MMEFKRTFTVASNVKPFRKGTKNLTVFFFFWKKVGWKNQPEKIDDMLKKIGGVIRLGKEQGFLKEILVQRRTSPMFVVKFTGLSQEASCI